ncbi:hypothetical protein CEXT_220161 [Caerostris extrusa]|uniref:Uncharacterized protein n=1 Tax=Caerostris extrusa TaxID=172846 RepID=A0AAV4MMP1_CAEEX|nr:hypothetical protein CEXT_220161 [Caerostris extrusa]
MCGIMQRAVEGLLIGHQRWTLVRREPQFIFVSKLERAKPQFGNPTASRSHFYVEFLVQEEKEKYDHYLSYAGGLWVFVVVGTSTPGCGCGYFSFYYGSNYAPGRLWLWVLLLLRYYGGTSTLGNGLEYFKSGLICQNKGNGKENKMVRRWWMNA